MALSILTTPAAGDTIQSSVWINEFNNIYNNPISLISPLTGTINLNGQTFSGTATFSGVITHSANLLFTDASYDIGASGATRPRDIFLSRNAIIGSTIELGHATDTTIARVSAGVISVEGSNVALASNNLSFFAATSSAQLAGVISDETGSGALVFATSPTLTTPVLGAATATSVISSTAGVNFQLTNTDSQYWVGGALSDPGWTIGAYLLQNGGALYQRSPTQTRLSQNVYDDGTARHIATAAAAMLELSTTAIVFYTSASVAAGTALTSVAQISVSVDGIILGSPTGSYQGTGTLNVGTNIFKNGTAYTNPDYVLEHFFTGKIIEFADREGASDYKGLRSLEEIEQLSRKYNTLPLIYEARQRNGGRLGLFDGGESIQASLEEAYLHLFNHEKRLKALETKT